MNELHPEKLFIKKTDLYNDHERSPGSCFSRNMYVSVNPWECFDLTDSFCYISLQYHEEKIETIEAENAKLKEDNKNLRLELSRARAFLTILKSNKEDQSINTNTLDSPDI